MANYNLFDNVLSESSRNTNVKNSFIDNHVNITNPELLTELLKHNSVILLSGHYNNWEWMGAKISTYYKEPFIAIYKRLNSSVFNRLLLNSRKRFGSIVVDMNDSIKYLMQNNSQSKIIRNELKLFKINVSVFRILYVSTKLSNKLDKKKIINLKKKFKTNKFGTVDKIFKNIVKIFEDKKNTTNSILFDTQKNKK